MHITDTVKEFVYATFDQCPLSLWVTFSCWRELNIGDICILNTLNDFHYSYQTDTDSYSINLPNRKMHEEVEVNGYQMDRCSKYVNQVSSDTTTPNQENWSNPVDQSGDQRYLPLTQYLCKILHLYTFSFFFT